MTFLTILGDMETVRSFRLVLEGKTGNEIPEPSRLEFFRKVFCKQFSFIYLFIKVDLHITLQ